jgi:hypothetical protein
MEIDVYQNARKLSTFYTAYFRWMKPHSYFPPKAEIIYCQEFANTVNPRQLGVIGREIIQIK